MAVLPVVGSSQGHISVVRPTSVVENKKTQQHNLACLGRISNKFTCTLDTHHNIPPYRATYHEVGWFLSAGGRTGLGSNGVREKKKKSKK